MARAYAIGLELKQTKTNGVSLSLDEKKKGIQRRHKLTSE